MGRELHDEDMGKIVRVLRHRNAEYIGKTGPLFEAAGSIADGLGPIIGGKRTCGVVLEEPEMFYEEDVELVDE